MQRFGWDVRSNSVKRIVAVVLVSSVVGCAPQSTPAPTAIAPPTTAPTTAATPTAVAATDTPAPAETPAQTPTVLPTPAPGISPTASADLGPLTTYRNEQAGFELDYPTSWQLIDVGAEAKQESVMYTASLFSWEQTGPGVHGIPEGQTKIDAAVMKTGAASPDEAATQYRQQIETADPPEKVLSEETWELVGGLTAYRWLVESRMGQAAVVVTALNGNTIVLAGLGDYAVFDQVARTLRAIAP